MPSLPDAAGKPSEVPTVKSLSDLPDPKETSVSIITPPPVTLKVLEEAKKLGSKSPTQNMHSHSPRDKH